ncbi:MAG: GTPase ObgE [Candidatus Saelkia tenebricola]|nr:GTPase ObgE [Candidatus Saelkia tenebricola]
MSFIDKTKIYVKAGCGGKGCFSFFFNKKVAKRLSDGGDGGKGGDVIVKVNPNLWDLNHLKFQRHIKASNGVHGGSNKKHGKNGADKIVEVPQGTIIREAKDNLLIRDLKNEDTSILVAKGGKGGIGNASTKSEAKVPFEGEEKVLNLELKLLADVGLVGFPNAGKTTFLNTLCQTKGKTAEYPFTTLDPLLGVIWHKDTAIKIADIPGLINDAHKSKGLGDLFLKHIQRTNILIFVMGLAKTDPLPWDAFKILKKELREFDPKLMGKEYFILANKMDLPGAEDKFKSLEKKIGKDYVLPISMVNKTGIEDARAKIISFFQ